MKRKHIQIFLAILLSVLCLLNTSCISSSQNLQCNSLEDWEREVIKQHHIKKRTSIISQTYDKYLDKITAFTGENKIEEIREYDKKGLPIKKSVWYFGFSEMDINEYGYDKLGRVSQIIRPNDQRKYIVNYKNESDCRKSSMVGYYKGKRIDSIAFSYSENNKQTTINYLLHQGKKAEVLDTNIYFLDDKDQIIENDNYLYKYEHDNAGRLIKSESTNKNTSEKIAYVYEYKDSLLVKSFRYENDQLVQINDIQYEYYMEK